MQGKSSRAGSSVCVAATKERSCLCFDYLCGVERMEGVFLGWRDFIYIGSSAQLVDIETKFRPMLVHF